MKEVIESDGEVYAIILRKNYTSNGIEFITPNHYGQQLGYMNHKAGHIIKPHIHNKVPREVLLTQEVLFVKSGLVKVDFYDENKIYFESKYIYKGDIIFLAKGGHGFQIIEDCEMIEVKQGPYLGEKDKTRFRNQVD